MGKQPGDAALPQEDINALLVELGGEGKLVVRLKGGDPFVFGRGGEEAEALAAAGVRFEVVPGVTAGVAAPAYAGIPVTHREVASAVAFVTAHEDPEKAESALDWDALARFPGTLVFYMGVKNLGRVSERLVAGGRDPDEPAAVVERGTLAGTAQRVGAAARDRRSGGRASPSARPPSWSSGPWRAMSDALSWLERRPLHGQVVAVTRARAQASGLAERLAGLGAEVVETPTIRIVPRVDDPDVTEAISRVRDYALVCFTSPNGVRLLFDALEAAGPRRPRLRRGDGGGDRPGHRRRAGAARDRGRRGARRARSPSRWSRRSGTCRWRGGRCSWRAPRRPATCSPTRSAEPGRARERRGPLRHGGASRSADDQRGAARARHLRDLHLQLDRPLLRRRPAGRFRRARAWSRSAR